MATSPGTGLVGAGDAAGRQRPNLWPPWSTSDTLIRIRDGPLPAELISVLLDRFRVSGEDSGVMSTEKRSGCPLHDFLGHLSSRPNPVPGFERLALFGFNQYRTVHILHLLLYAPVNLYSSEQQLFAFCRELPREGLPPVVELGIDTFGVRRTMRDVPRVDHVSHLEGPPPPPLTDRIPLARGQERYRGGL